ncbi:uncharacterized protein [Cherax quadricarinatus]|uniref:uncharacterized protein n=1 Tax=Cherax quadricarinatus TaxID=27406 RepID=UPI00387E6F9D
MKIETDVQQIHADLTREGPVLDIFILFSNLYTSRATFTDPGGGRKQDRSANEICCMKIVALLLLALLGLVVCEPPPPHFNRFFPQQVQQRPQTFHRRPPPFQRPFQGGGFQTRPRFQSPPRPAPQQFSSGGAVDATLGRSEYYFSWRHDGGRKYTGTEAARVCTSLGRGWQPIGISSGEEIAFVISVVGGDRVEYIWTGGVRTGNGNEFIWVNGEPFTVNNWSHTGGIPSYSWSIELREDAHLTKNVNLGRLKHFVRRYKVSWVPGLPISYSIFLNSSSFFLRIVLTASVPRGAASKTLFLEAMTDAPSSLDLSASI